jgi:hypothetical protein
MRMTPIKRITADLQWQIRCDQPNPRHLRPLFWLAQGIVQISTTGKGNSRLFVAFVAGDYLAKSLWLNYEKSEHLSGFRS